MRTSRSTGPGHLLPHWGAGRDEGEPNIQRRKIMKTKMMVGAWLLAGLLVARAQSGYVVTERGADWNVLQKTTVENGTNVFIATWNWQRA